MKLLTKERKEAIKKHFKLSETIRQDRGESYSKTEDKVCMFCKLAQALDLKTNGFNRDRASYDYFNSFTSRQFDRVLRNEFRKALQRYYIAETKLWPQDEMDSNSIDIEAFYGLRLIGSNSGANWDKVFSYMEEK